MQDPLVSIIIVQYNNSQDTIGCLESIKNLDYPNYSVIIIDNASSIKDSNAVRLFVESQQDKRFEIIHSEKNLGYAGGNNLGIKKALEKRPDYFFILNPDTIIEKGSLANMVEIGESDIRIGIIGPAINENEHMVYGGKIEWLRPELHHNKAAPTNNGSTVLRSLAEAHSKSSPSKDYLPTTSYLIGAAMMIKKNVIENIGLLDERYFLYFEDADYCIRASKADYKLSLASEAKVVHAVSASTTQLGSPLLLRYHFRNAHLFNLKNAPWHIKLALPFWSFFIIIKQIIKLFLVPSKREISKTILTGVMDFYRSNFGKINA